MTDQARDLASALTALDASKDPRDRARAASFRDEQDAILRTAREAGWSPPPPVTPVAETVARLRELLARATQGPLDIERRDDDGGGIDYVVYGPEGDFAICFDTDRGGAAKASAEWLVLAHTEMPALLDAIPLAKVWTRDDMHKAFELGWYASVANGKLLIHPDTGEADIALPPVNYDDLAALLDGEKP